MKNTTPFLFSMYSMIILSTTLVIMSPTWIAAWIMLEVNMLTFIPVMSNNKWNQETEAATKYFLAQALGSLLLLLGGAMQSQIFMSLLPLIILMTALLLKLGAAPCHMWYPSVMSAMSWTNCLILSTWQKLAPLALLLSLSKMPQTNLILMIMAGINTLLGGVMGMNQIHLRQLLAYSSIGHMGWILSMASINMNTPAMLYFLMYSVLVAPVFLCLNFFNSMTVKDINSESSPNKLISPMLSILMMSLAGLPPLTGFIPKFMVIMNMMNSYYIIIFILLAGSYMNLYYYLNISLSSIFLFINNNMENKPTITTPMIPILSIMSMSMIGLIIMF